MKEIQKKSLINVNEKSLGYKIKNFFNGSFKKKEYGLQKESNNIQKYYDKRKQDFLNNVRNVENEETKFLKLQRQYESGNIGFYDLTDAQRKSLYNFYELQNKKIKKSNDDQKQKLLKNNKKVYIQSIKNICDEDKRLELLGLAFKNGDIEESDLTKSEIKSICHLYRKQNNELKINNKYRKYKILRYRNMRKVI